MVTRAVTNVSVAMRSMLAAALLPPGTHSVVASATKSACVSPTAHSLIQLIVSGSVRRIDLRLNYRAALSIKPV